MPELPEVETTVRGLQKKIIGKEIKDLWTDWPNFFKEPNTEKDFLECVTGKKIKDVKRKGKNILIYLSGDYILLIHQKMSGHLLYGKWRKNKDLEDINNIWKNEIWVPDLLKGKMADSKNKFIRLIFFLDGGKMLALSDLRRFAKFVCGPTNEILHSKHLDLGPDPLQKDFDFNNFKEIVKNRKKRIKTLLMDQKIISGIGNIYSDEVLWRAKIHPLTPSLRIKTNKLKILYEEIVKILKEAIELKGTSIDDYRNPEGEKGEYGEKLDVYQKDGYPCPRCGERIKKIKISGRSARFCPNCQKE